MKTQQELKQQYEQELRKVYGPTREGTVQYAVSKIQRVVELSNGKLYVIEKQPIQTSFCYGYGWSGVVVDREEMEAARDLARQARTNEDFFTAENMKCFSLFDRGDASYQKLGIEMPSTKSNRIVAIHWVSGPMEYYRDIKPLSAEDEDILRQAYEEEKAVHLKKIKAYLKRYGLSKVNSWSYLVD